MFHMYSKTVCVLLLGESSVGIRGIRLVDGVFRLPCIFGYFSIYFNDCGGRRIEIFNCDHGIRVHLPSILSVLSSWILSLFW